MITSVIGRTFLTAYNEKYDKNLSAKAFFEEEYWPLFYNAPKYLQWVTNSPFVQMKRGQKAHLLSETERLGKLEALYEKVDEEIPDASFALGFPASETKGYASTSGLVSDMDIPTEEEDVYLSWMGSGLGIGVAGGFTILFDDPYITLRTFEGWKVYRQYLNDPSLERMRGNQINTWNGQWLTYDMDPYRFREDFDFATLVEEGFFKVDSTTVEALTLNWSQLFFSLSRQFPETEMMGYVYGFGQTNKTIGFIPFQFRSGSTLKEVYRKLIDKEMFGDFKVDKQDFERLFGIHIKRACELGSIGLPALRPHNLTKYMRDKKNLSFNKEEDIIHYQAYKTWLIAMLSKNKEEIIDYTMALAKVIQRYRAGARKTDRKNLIEKELFASVSKRGFIEALEQMVKDLDGEDLPAIKQLKDEVHLMTNEEYGYFCTLLKFDYAFVEKQA